MCSTHVVTGLAQIQAKLERHIVSIEVLGDGMLTYDPCTATT